MLDNIDEVPVTTGRVAKTYKTRIKRTASGRAEKGKSLAKVRSLLTKEPLRTGEIVRIGKVHQSTLSRILTRPEFEKNDDGKWEYDAKKAR